MKKSNYKMLWLNYIPAQVNGAFRAHLFDKLGGDYIAKYFSLPSSRRELKWLRVSQLGTESNVLVCLLFNLCGIH